MDDIRPNVPPEWDRGTPYTVVIPVWDEPYVTFLGDAVASARRHAPEAQIVIVDNASMVPLPRLPAEVETIKTGRRLTAGMARNAGLAAVRTRHVAFLDADDLVVGSFDGLSQQLDMNPGTVAVIGRIEEEDGRLHNSPRPIARLLAPVPALLAVGTATWSLFPTQGCAVLRTDVVRSVGGYGNSDGGEDWELAVSVALAGRVRFVEETIRCYRRSLGGLGDRPGTAEMARRAVNARARLAAKPWGRRLSPAVRLAQALLIRVVQPLLAWASRSGSRAAPTP